jgi:hypothetical protein
MTRLQQLRRLLSRDVVTGERTGLRDVENIYRQLHLRLYYGKIYNKKQKIKYCHVKDGMRDEKTGSSWMIGFINTLVTHTLS